MESAGEGGGNRVEGWLYVIHTRRLAIRSPRRRYFILEGRQAACYKSKPSNQDKASMKTGIIYPFTKIVDNGRETVHGQLLHAFTLSDPNVSEYQLKLAAKSAEEAAKWMSAFKEAAEQTKKDDIPQLRNKRRFGISVGHESLEPEDVIADKEFTAWTEPWLSNGQADVISSSPWKLLGCKNGLRLFRESSKGRFASKFSDDHPAIMAVGVIKASCESIFENVMALGPSRTEWDFCFLRGRVEERIDGHTDIIHKQLHRKWLPGHMRKRDLVLLRLWRRETDGSYVILYRSLKYKKCPTKRGCVRANLKSGGYVISPLTAQGEYPARSVIKHMLEIDWNTWKSHFRPSRVQDITLRMVERIASLRELYKTKPRPSPTTTTSAAAVPTSNATAAIEDKLMVENDGKVVTQTSKTPRFDPEMRDSFLHLSDAEEFFDAEDDDDEVTDDDDPLHSLTETDGEEDPAVNQVPKLSAAATFVKRLHELATAAQQKKSEAETTTSEGGDVNGLSLDKECSLPKASVFNSYCCWNVADPGTFLIRGKKYLRDHQKVKAKDTLMQLVGVDWLKSTAREDHVAGRPNNFMQRPKVRKLNRCFFFIVNLQVPGSTTYSLVLYYVMNDSLSKFPLLERFVNGDDRFRDAHFKLIPHIAQGSWIVKQSVGKTACLIGEALDISYFNGKNYIELDIDVGSSSVAKGVVSLVFGYMSKLVIEMAFLIQADTEDDLPEVLLGTCRISSLDVSKSTQLLPTSTTSS